MKKSRSNQQEIEGTLDFLAKRERSSSRDSTIRKSSMLRKLI
jgi:hypothetical protein